MDEEKKGMVCSINARILIVVEGRPKKYKLSSGFNPTCNVSIELRRAYVIYVGFT